MKKVLDKSESIMYNPKCKEEIRKEVKKMKKFVYQVAGFEYTDTEAFGTAWKQAKAEAARLNAAVYRLVIKGENVRQEVYVNGGCFLSVAYAKPEDIHLF